MRGDCFRFLQDSVVEWDRVDVVQDLIAVADRQALPPQDASDLGAQDARGNDAIIVSAGRVVEPLGRWRRMAKHNAYRDGTVEVVVRHHRPFSSLRSSSIVDAVVRSCRASVRVRAGQLAFRGMRVADETAGMIVPIRWLWRVSAYGSPPSRSAIIGAGFWRSSPTEIDFIAPRVPENCL